MVIAGIVVAGALLLCLSVLTGVGEHSRGAAARVIVLAGFSSRSPGSSGT